MDNLSDINRWSVIYCLENLKPDAQYTLNGSNLAQIRYMENWKYIINYVRHNPTTTKSIIRYLKETHESQPQS